MYWLLESEDDDFLADGGDLFDEERMVEYLKELAGEIDTFIQIELEYYDTDDCMQEYASYVKDEAVFRPEMDLDLLEELKERYGEKLISHGDTNEEVIHWISELLLEGNVENNVDTYSNYGYTLRNNTLVYGSVSYEHPVLELPEDIQDKLKILEPEEFKIVKSEVGDGYLCSTDYVEVSLDDSGVYVWVNRPSIIEFLDAHFLEE